jgi:hypothetical protein
VLAIETPTFATSDGVPMTLVNRHCSWEIILQKKKLFNPSGTAIIIAFPTLPISYNVHGSCFASSLASHTA